MSTKKLSFDLQVNGYLSIGFSSPDLTEDAVRETFSKYLKKGASSFLPTLITSPDKILKKNFKIIARVIDERPYKKYIPGFHLEGPFISPEPGAVGAHNPRWVKRPDFGLLNNYNEWADGKIKLITIAAEIKGAGKFCKQATGAGIAVSLGHQMAGLSDLKRLSQEGARALTHLGNGMPKQVNRHDNSLLNGLFIH